MNKLKNILNRIDWMHGFLEGRVDLCQVDSKHLKDAKAFCGFSVAGCFDKISYNTVKSQLLAAPKTEFRAHSFKDNFDYFLELRKSVYLKVSAVEEDEAKGSDKYTELDWKHFYRNALWQSSLCANAYLSLRRDLKSILNERSDGNELIVRRIEKVLCQSDAVYKKIIASKPEPYSPDLKVVRG
ncbi:hypothetical protein [Pseudomonas putida]|uniref:hypothetical protein n=1 Tax=Pseudomonas putida TaxID=303 RepID=UPI000AEDA521|nr:hypothetical protein [Pseudomonas putida]